MQERDSCAMVKPLDWSWHLLVDPLVYLLLSLLENLIVHRHICIDLAEEVRIELELQLVILFSLLLFFRLCVQSLLGILGCTRLLGGVDDVA